MTRRSPSKKMKEYFKKYPWTISRKKINKLVGHTNYNKKKKTSS